jgi:hypothetical protein
MGRQERCLVGEQWRWGWAASDFDVDGWVRQEVVEVNGEQARGSSVTGNEERDQVRYR